MYITYKIQNNFELKASQSLLTSLWHGKHSQLTTEGE